MFFTYVDCELEAMICHGLKFTINIKRGPMKVVDFLAQCVHVATLEAWLIVRQAIFMAKIKLGNLWLRILVEWYRITDK
jgi:hypothetical protein